MNTIKIYSFTILFSLVYTQDYYRTELISQLDYDYGVNDIWGYETPSGREFAIVGTDEGTSIVEIVVDTNGLQYLIEIKTL